MLDLKTRVLEEILDGKLLSEIEDLNTILENHLENIYKRRW